MAHFDVGFFPLHVKLVYQRINNINLFNTFFYIFLEKLKAATAACIAAISSGNKKNQDALLEAGALE